MLEYLQKRGASGLRVLVGFAQFFGCRMIFFLLLVPFFFKVSSVSFIHASKILSVNRVVKNSERAGRFCTQLGISIPAAGSR